MKERVITIIITAIIAIGLFLAGLAGILSSDETITNKIIGIIVVALIEGGLMSLFIYYITD